MNLSLYYKARDVMPCETHTTLNTTLQSGITVFMHSCKGKNRPQKV